MCKKLKKKLEAKGFKKFFLEQKGSNYVSDDLETKDKRERAAQL